MRERITISEFDYKRLKNLMDYHPAPRLEEELKQADIVKDILVLPDLVTIDSTVLYSVNEQLRQSTLVSADVPEGQNLCVSVLDELGTALIGLRENQELKWECHEGEWNIRVYKVVYQPEAMGQIHPLCFH